MGILALDPTLAPLLERVADMTVEVLPGWIESETFEEDRGLEPMSVITYGIGELPRVARASSCSHSNGSVGITLL